MTETIHMKIAALKRTLKELRNDVDFQK